jgi:hypothetical protein
MIFEIKLDQLLIDKYRDRFETLKPRDFTQNDMTNNDNDNETRYVFWLLSIRNEIEKFDKNSKKYIETEVIFDEALNMIEDGKPRTIDEGIYNIIVYCEIVDNLVTYIGSVYYTIRVKEGTPYNENELGKWIRTNRAQKILFFLSIYKSNINSCTTCSDKSFSTQMLSYIEKKGLDTECVCLYTSPIGEMRQILKNNGFLDGFVKPLTKIGGYKRKRLKRKNTKKKGIKKKRKTRRKI